MFYVGNILWMEIGETTQDIPNFPNFSGCVRWAWGRLEWFKKGLRQSPQDPETQEWMSSVINPPTMLYPNGRKLWYNKGILVNPETYDWGRGDY